MTSKGSLQSIVWFSATVISGLEKRIQLWRYLSIYFLLWNVVHIFLGFLLLTVQRELKIMFQDLEVKLEYRIVVYKKYSTVAGEISWHKDVRAAHSTRICTGFDCQHLEKGWGLQGISFHYIRPFSLFIVGRNCYFSK